MLRRLRVFVSLSAALPVAFSDGESRSGDPPVYNFRATAETGHFLGHLFRTLGQVLRVTETQSTNDGQNQENKMEEKGRKTRRGK